MIKTVVKASTYMDSIFLMNASRELMKIPGVSSAVAVMGSDMNKSVLEELGALTQEAKAATASDLVISLDVDGEDRIPLAEKRLAELLAGTGGRAAPDLPEYRTFNLAADANPDATIAVISVPGEFAMREAMAALDRGMNPFIFSDMPEDEELALKAIGRERNILVMGPGCGTAVINNISLGLMSKVRPGRIGIVGASGSGIHEISALIHRSGEGVSQAIGTGGRDLSERVGGSTMLQGIDYLSGDPGTEVLVLVSKPPHPATMKKIFASLPGNKPTVIFFLGGNPAEIRAAGAHPAATLEDAAAMAVRFARGERAGAGDAVAAAKAELSELVTRERALLGPGRKYLRGLFCGGTHSEEAVLLLQEFVPDLHSNLRFGKVTMLANRQVSEKNSLVDMGDEEFTRGRPHPVMDPSILCDRLLREARDPEVGVVFFDLLFGHGASPDPVGAIEGALREIRERLSAEKRRLLLLASLCGTDLDPQDLAEQRRRIESLGVAILPSNAKAALAAGMIVS